MKKLFATFLLATAFLFTGVVGDAAQRKTTQLQTQDHLPNYCLLIKDERTPQENCPIGQDPIVRTHHKQRAAKQATLAKQRHQTTVPKVNQTPPAKQQTEQPTKQGVQDGTGPVRLQDPQNENCPNPAPPAAVNEPTTEPVPTAPTPDAADPVVCPQPQDGTGNQYGNTNDEPPVQTPRHNRQNTPTTNQHGHGQREDSGTRGQRGHHTGN